MTGFRGPADLDVSVGPVATFKWHPEEDLGPVVVKARWSADNGVETATFPTLKEAKDFARVRWGWRG